jgi:hypothetical protein
MILLAGAALGAMVLADGAAVAGDQGAQAAKKKKCKPGFKKVKVKGKKKCRRVVIPPAATPAPTPPSPPTVRATLTWDNPTDTPADVDLHIWDQSGNMDGGPGLGIPAAIGPSDSQAFGPETFTDLLFPSTRQFSYGICMQSDPPPPDTIAKLVYTLADGSTQTHTTAAGDLVAAGDFRAVATPNGFPPSGATC